MAEQPDILMIISHDTGQHLGCYGAAVQTPNLDRLAAEGVRFENSFCVAAQCSPSRGTLLTGRYPHVNGLMGLAHLGWNFHPDEVCLPQYLNEAGYETHLFGIQHEAPKDNVERLGYGHIHPMPQDNRRVDGAATQVIDHLTTRGTAAERPPLFTMVGLFETHRPFEHPTYTPDDPATVQLPLYLPDTPGIREDFGWFQGMTRTMDSGIGTLRDALEQTGLTQKTLVIYTTDHGIAFPRAKGMSYDPGLETALIMRWPGHIEPGSVRNETVCHLDFLPTLLDIIGAPQPDGLAGQSYLPLLTGAAYEPREDFFVEMTWHDKYNPQRGIRTNRYKYIRNFEPDLPLVYVPRDILKAPSGVGLPEAYYGEKRPPEELYDMEADPLEQNNVVNSPEYVDVLNDLRQRVQRWMEETDDPLLQGSIPPTPEQANVD